MPRVSAAHEQAVRTRILEAALRAFSEKGYHGTSMQDVVRESGLSVGAIYTHFRSKDELFVGACDLSQSSGMAELARRIVAGRTFPEKLAIAIGFYLDAVDAADGGPGMASFLIAEWAQAEQDPAVREMLVRRREGIAAAGQLLIREGIATGELPPWVDAEALGSAFSVFLDGLLLWRIEQGSAYRRADAERRAGTMLELVLAANGGGRPEVVPAVATPWSPPGLAESAR